MIKMGNTSTRTRDNCELYLDYDADTNSINRGTQDMPKPQLRFHQVCGTNIHLLKDSRVARRHESFCKGLAFSNRPIGIDEIVCLRLVEVGTNWSGVMRYGVTNVDPSSFRDIELPKFACPDLTSKGGYWAKSLSERYSVQNAILHFFINKNGEMFYGINGVSKGVFISGINTALPMWIILDIYGNSIGLEFVDPNEIPLPLPSPRITRHSSSLMESGESNEDLSGFASTNLNTPTRSSQQSIKQRYNCTTPVLTNNSNSAGNLSLMSVNASRTSARASPMTFSKMRFHGVKGINITLHNDDTVATRKRGEYYLGYVFTERPLHIDEKLIILVSMVDDAFSGGLAFGLTSCDPTLVPASRLPVDSDELLERPEYWVCIKDVGATPQVGDKLSFRVDSDGRVFFAKNDAPERVIVHVDTSIPLWAFFDLYGSTRKIQILDLSVVTPSSSELARSYRASSEGCSNISLPEVTTEHLNRPTSASWTAAGSLRVALPNEPSSSLPVPTSQTSAAHSTLMGTSPSSAPATGNPFEGRLRVDFGNGNRRQARRTLPATTDVSRSSLLNDSSSSVGSPDEPERSYRDRSEHHSPRTHRQSDLILPSVAEILANSRRRLLPPTTTAPSLQSFQRDRDSRIVNRTTTFAEISENHLPSSSNPSASITVPVKPPPLLSSLAVSSNDEEQNKTNRAVEFEESGAGLAENNQNDDNGGDIGSECTICMSNRVNAVIYRCGHMCMCFSCAKETQKRSGDCPICRSRIIDVIRCYPS